MKVLITGANGFLGRAIVEEFSDRGDEVFTTGRSAEAGLPNYIPADIAGDLRHLRTLVSIETVVHAAGLAHQFKGALKEDFERVNVLGTRRIAELARELRAKKFIFISSVAVYGDADFSRSAFEEDAVCNPLSFYASSKLASEQAATEIFRHSETDLTILRPATIVGEGDPGNVSRLIRALDAGRFFWLGRGKNLKSLIYKKDVARACLSVAAKASDGNPQIFNVTAAPVSMREIVSEIEDVLGKRASKHSIPESPLKQALRIAGKTRIRKLENLRQTLEKWLSDDVFSGAKISSMLGFVPEIEALEAVRREVLFYKVNEACA